jgi:hypothetical protein
MSEQEREWRSAKGYEGWYDVSSDGLVRRSPDAPPRKATYPGRILNPDCATGYNRVYLQVNGKVCRELVHRLVAMAFLPTVASGRHVNHMDGNKLNNRVDNLEWATPRENTRHAWRTGLCTPVQGERSGNSKLCDNDVYIIRCAARHGIPLSMIASRYGVTYQLIYQIATFKIWRHLQPEIEVA